MKKKMYQLLMLLLCVGMLLGVSITAEAKSDKTNGKYMKKVITAYKKGQYKKAIRYNKKMDKTITESCVKKMPKKMKKAYKKVVKKWHEGKMDEHARVLAFYLTDIDNDKKADMLVRVGTCEADARMVLYQYKKGKAKKIGMIAASHAYPHAYPNHKGVVLMWGHMGGEGMSLLTVKNGKLNGKPMGDRLVDYQKGEKFLSLGCKLDDNMKNISTSPYIVPDYSVFK